MEPISVVTALAALAQESRLSIFRILVQAGADGLAAGKLAELAGIAPSSLTFHLKEMSNAQMVSARKAGRFVIYSANFATMNALIGYLTENCCVGSCAPEDIVCRAAVKQLVVKLETSHV
jgi:DNA-binding transcriptional ArsR family regulator